MSDNEIKLFIKSLFDNKGINEAEKGIKSLEGEIKRLQELQANTKDPFEFSKIGSKIQGLEGDLRGLKVEAETAGKSSAGLGEAIGGIAGKAGPAAAVLATVVGALTAYVGAAAAAAANTAAYVKEQDNIARATGASKELIAALSLGLQRNGADAKESADALLQLGQVLTSALGDPAGQSAKQFEELGVKITDSAGKARSIEDVFRDIDKSFKETGASQEKIIALSQILGEDSSKKLLPLIGNFSELEKEARKAGLVISDETAAAANKLTGNFAGLKAELEGFANQIGGDLIPAFNDVVDAAQRAFAELASSRDFTEGIKALTRATADLISNYGPPLISLIEDTLGLIGKIGTAVDIILHPLDELNLRLINSSRAQKAAEEAERSHTKSHQEHAASAAAAGQATAAYEASIRNLIAAQKQAFELQQSLNKTQIDNINAISRTRILTEQEAADQIFAIQAEELQKALENANSILIATKANTKERIEAEKQYRDAFNSIQESIAKKIDDDAKRRLASQIGLLQDLINTNAAEVRRETSIIEEEEKKREISHAKSVEQRIEISRKAFQDELDGLNLILQRTDLTEQERTTLLRRRQAVIDEIRQFEIDSSHSIRDAQLKDEQELLDKRSARLNREKQDNDRKLEQLRRNGATELDIAQQSDRFLKQSLGDQINLLNDVLDAKRKQGAPDAEIVDLQTQIKGLEQQRLDLQRGLIGAVVELYNKEAEGLQKLNAGIEALGNRADSLTSKLEETAQKSALSIGSSYKLAEKSSEDLSKRQLELIDRLNSATTASGALTIEEIHSIQDELAAIAAEQASRFNAALAQQASANQAEIDKEAEQRRAGAEAVFQIAKDEASKLSALDQDNFNKVKSINDQKTKLETNYTAAVDAEAEKQKEARIRAVRDALLAAAEIIKQSEISENEKRIDFLKKRGDLEGQIAEASSKLAADKAAIAAGATGQELDRLNSETAELQSKINALVAEKTKLQSDEDNRQKREKELLDRNAKTRSEFEGKIRNAKTSEEAKALQAQEAAQLAANEKIVDLEIQKDQTLKDLQGKASQETLDALAKQYDEEISRTQELTDGKKQELQNQLDDELAAQAAAAKARDDDYHKQLDALNTALSDQQNAYKSAYKAILDDAASKLADLQAKNDSINISSLAQQFLSGAGISNAAIDSTIAKLGQLAAAAQAAQQAIDNATGTTAPSSSTSSSSPSSSPSNSPFSAPGSPSGGTPTFLGPTARATPGQPPTPNKKKTPSPGSQPSEGAPKTSSGSKSGEGAGSNTGNQPGSQGDQGPSAKPGQGSPGSAGDAKSFHKAMAAIYNDHHGNGGPKVYQLIYDKVKEYASAAGAKPQGAILSIITDHGEVQLNSRAGDLATLCGNEAQNKYFNLVDAIIGEVESAAGQNKKKEQADTTGATQGDTSGGLTTTGGKGSKKENDPSRGSDKGAGTGATTSGSGTVGPPSNEAPNPNKNRVGGADITRGDTQFDADDQALADKQHAGDFSSVGGGKGSINAPVSVAVQAGVQIALNGTLSQQGVTKLKGAVRGIVVDVFNDPQIQRLLQQKLAQLQNDQDILELGSEAFT